VGTDGKSLAHLDQVGVRDAVQLDDLRDSRAVSPGDDCQGLATLDDVVDDVFTFLVLDDYGCRCW